MPGLSYQKTVAYCELLSATLKPQLEEMPHLKEESASLDALVTELKDLDNQQQTLKGRLLEITHLRQARNGGGRRSAARIAAPTPGEARLHQREPARLRDHPAQDGAPPARHQAARGEPAHHLRHLMSLFL